MARSVSDAQILHAALEVLAQEGYVGATTRQIAAAAGINEVTLFRRFGSKQKLLKAAVEQEAAAFAAAGIEYSGDVAADLLRVVHFYQHIVEDRGRLIAVLLAEVPRQPELLELMQTPLEIMARVGALLERYQAEGALIKEPPMQAFMALVGPLFLGGILGYVSGGRAGMAPAALDASAHVQRYLGGRAAGQAVVSAP
jgi:AcrR family transcriptional regulator